MRLHAVGFVLLAERDVLRLCVELDAQRVAGLVALVGRHWYDAVFLVLDFKAANDKLCCLRPHVLHLCLWLVVVYSIDAFGHLENDEADLRPCLAVGWAQLIGVHHSPVGLLELDVDPYAFDERVVELKGVLSVLQPFLGFGGESAVAGAELVEIASLEVPMVLTVVANGKVIEVLHEVLELHGEDTI